MKLKLRKARFLAAFFLSLSSAVLLPAQSPPEGESPAAGENGLPRVFREIRLGMSLEDLKAALQRDAMFSFRGDRDVSLLPARDQSLVETTGLSFVKRAFFQLRDGRLFIMAFTLNSDLVDHYSVFSSLTEKYGQPDTLSPQQAVWERENTRLALERPLTVKYIDLEAFNSIIGESRTAESHEVRQRQEFLDGF
ncbi:MAG: hypothetical protein LBH26_02330 [Treponema sp.]|jgi:hypothetical protein|nr:hypothetical protein [Treponema sp.]